MIPLVENNHIILALDVNTKREAFKILVQCRDHIDAVKYNYPLVLKEGLQIIKETKYRFSIPIIADFKIADVPVTNNEIVRLAMNGGADFITIWGFIGRDPLKECLKITRGKMGIIVMTELTHRCGLDFTGRFAASFALLAKSLGCYGIQAPGNRPNRVKTLREIIGNEPVIVCCGIGAQGGCLREAIEAGANFGIIGRSIYIDKDPKKAAIRFLSKLKNNEKSRD